MIANTKQEVNSKNGLVLSQTLPKQQSKKEHVAPMADAREGEQPIKTTNL
jgi:hypothetical protein